MTRVRALSVRAVAAAALIAGLLPLSRTAEAAAPPSPASTVLGMTVVDAKNKRLGAVTDLAVDLDKGQVVGLQVGRSTADGMVYDVYPWSTVQFDNNKVVVRGGSIGGETTDMQSLKKMIHATLQDAEGKTAGEVDDVMVGFDDGHVASLLIHFDPKWVDITAQAAIPPTRLERKGDGFLAKFSAAELKPGWKPTPPAPPPAARARLSQLSDAAAVEAFAKAPENLAVARRLLASRVISSEGKPVGKVEDVVVDKANGKVEFVIASFIPDWVAAGWLVIAPARPIQTDSNGQPAIRISLNEINNAFLFQATSWPDFTNPGVGAAIHAKIDRM